jgi:phenylacetate-CoA ligase
MKLTIVVPCFNEMSNITILCDRISNSMIKSKIPFEVFLVDDFSNDKTWETIEKNISVRPNFFGIKNNKNMGIFESWKVAISQANGELICLIDADLQNQPEDIVRLYNKFTFENSHVIQAIRSSIEWKKDTRYFASRALNFLLNLLFKDSAKDNKSGFIIAPKTILQEILVFRNKYFYPHTFIRVATKSSGYTISEIETLFAPRKSGKSFLDNKSIFLVCSKVLFDIFVALREFGRGSGQPQETFIDKYSSLKETVSRAEEYKGWRKIIFDIYFSTLPLHTWLITKSTKNIYKILNRTQWLSRDEIIEMQNSRLQRLIWHVYSNVPYYQNLFKSNEIHPSQIRTVDDLLKIPKLNKLDVRNNLYMDLFSIGHQKKDMHKIATSGSTGEPFVTYADKRQLEIRFATTLRCLEWTGWKFGDRQLRLWHQKLGMSWSQVFKERLDAILLRRRFIPAFEFTEQDLNKFVKKLNRFKPKLIDGYAESLNFLSIYLKNGGALKFRPKGVMSSAQMLTSSTRSEIESALGTKVFDKYGAREFSGIAYQCQFSNDHHVMDESYIVEILVNDKPARPGEIGEIVITDLNNYSVPLIRYRIGDLAVAVDNEIDCKCGRGLSRIGDIQGRTQALVYCTNGRWLPGTFFAHFFKDFDNIVLHFQVIQKNRDGFILKIVKGIHWNIEDWNILINQLSNFVGKTPIEVEFVDTIPLLNTGKRTPVISYLKIDFQSLKIDSNENEIL